MDANLSLARKEKNDQLLMSLSVPVNLHLPRIEDESEAKIRSAQDIARRALVLYIVVLAAHNAIADPSGWLKHNHLWTSTSPKEKAFLENSDRPTKDASIATWRAEALWVLLWAMEKIDMLDFPTKLCDTGVAQNVLPKPGDSIEDFINQASLRSPSDLLDAADLIYRIDWAVVDARLKKKAMPAGLNADAVYERHYVLNWLIGYGDEWDEITTDT